MNCRCLSYCPTYRPVCRALAIPCIRKTGKLLFLLEKARKAAISGPKHGKHTIVKQSLFSKSIRTQILCKMLSLLGQAGKSTEKYRRGNLWGSDTKLHNLQNVLSILKYGCESTTALAIKHRMTVQSCMHADLCRISN